MREKKSPCFFLPFSLFFALKHPIITDFQISVNARVQKILYIKNLKRNRDYINILRQICTFFQ